MTIEEFELWADREENCEQLWELFDGEPVEVPFGSECHGAVCATVSFVLTTYTVRRNRGRVLIGRVGFVLDPETLLGPDLMFFDENWSWEEIPKGYVRKPPPFLVEVVNFSDTREWLNRRVERFLQRGVSVVWVVDPEERTVSVHREAVPTLQLTESDELTGNGVLPDFRCKVADLFRLPGQA